MSSRPLAVAIDRLGPLPEIIQRLVDRFAQQGSEVKRMAGIHVGNRLLTRILQLRLEPPAIFGQVERQLQ